MNRTLETVAAATGVLALAVWLAAAGPLTGTRPSSGAAEPERAGDCRPGFVPRRAVPGDEVCVGFQSRDRVRLENRLAGRRGEGSACRDGFVPRQAQPGDATCVTPSAQAWVRLENAAAARRSALAAVGARLATK